MKGPRLQVRSDRGRHPSGADRATDDPAELGEVDIVLFCVKLWDVESAGQNIRPLIGPDTAVIPLRTASTPRAADPILGSNAVMGAWRRSARRSQGRVVIQQSDFHAMIFGETRRQAQQGAARFSRSCLRAGFDATLSEQILTDLWMKFILLASNASMMAATRQPIGNFARSRSASIFVSAYREWSMSAAPKALRCRPTR